MRWAGWVVSPDWLIQALWSCQEMAVIVRGAESRLI